MVAVKYKYSNESPITIPNADDYVIEDSLDLNSVRRWEIFGKYTDNYYFKDGYQNRMFVSNVGRHSNVLITERFAYVKRWEEVENTGKYNILERTFDPSEAIAIEATYWTTDVKSGFHDWQTYDDYLRERNSRNGNYPEPGRAYAINGLDKFIHYSHVRSWNINLWHPTKEYFMKDLEILFYHPAQCLRLYTLKIFERGSLVFSRAENIRPQYVQIINAKECPPNTCPVECGRNICCYGSDGIAVTTFLKGESIYQ